MDSSTTFATEDELSTAGIMTPSSSGRTVKFLEPMFPTPIPYPYLSPSPTPSPIYRPIPREVFDILGCLYCSGPLEMAQKILSYLDAADLFRCLLVCKTWNIMVSQDTHLVRKMNTYNKNRRKRSFSQMMSGHTSVEFIPRPPSRQILADISINSLQLFELPRSSEIPQGSRQFQPHLKYCICPNCQSSATELNLRRAKCTKCKYDFCKHCFRPYHEGYCRSKQELWGGEEDCDNGPSKIHIAGKKSKAVKRRLRRL